MCAWKKEASLSRHAFTRTYYISGVAAPWIAQAARTVLCSRQVLRLGLVDHKRRLTTSSKREKPTFGGTNGNQARSTAVCY